MDRLHLAILNSSWPFFGMVSKNVTQLLVVGDLQRENSWMKFGHGLNQLAIVAFYDLGWWIQVVVFTEIHSSFVRPPGVGIFTW